MTPETTVDHHVKYRACHLKGAWEKEGVYPPKGNNRLPCSQEDEHTENTTYLLHACIVWRS